MKYSLLARVPEISDTYKRHDAAWRRIVPDAELGSDDVFGTVLPDFLRDLQRRGGLPPDVASRLFELLEEFMGDENENVPMVIKVSFLEQIETDRELCLALHPHMGPLVGARLVVPAP